MKKIYLLSFVLCFYISTKAQDTTRILFIGNSFTFYNNMPQIVKDLADSADLPVIFGMHAPGGVSVGDTAQGTMAHMNNPVLFSMIRSKKWDFAVIQDNQGRFVQDSAVFPSKSKVVQGHLNIMDSVKKNNNCAKIILFGGWAWKYGSPPFGNTGAETIKRLLINYCVLNDTMKEIIAPIGEAWMKASSQMSSVNLWDTDDAHPSYAGSYLTASVIFSTIFNLPAKSYSYSGSMSPATAQSLRVFADSSVFGINFHTRYNLGGVKPLEPVYNNGQLSLPGSYSNYRWYKNGLYISSASVLALQGNASYSVEVRENDGCIIKSCSYSEITTGITGEELLSGVQVFPNPVVGGYFIIKSEKPLDRIELYNVAGVKQTVLVEPSANGLTLSTEELKQGCYLLFLSTKTQSLRKKIIISE